MVATLLRNARADNVVDIACTPPFIPSPFGEITDLGPMLAANDVAISQIGPGRRSCWPPATTTPPHHRRRFARAHCGCDVSRYTIRNSGHVYQVHAPLRKTVDAFVQWLSSRGLPPSPRR